MGLLSRSWLRRLLSELRPNGSLEKCREERSRWREEQEQRLQAGNTRGAFGEQKGDQCGLLMGQEGVTVNKGEGRLM